MATCRLTHLPASATLLMASHLAAQEPIPIGSRLDAPWEGNACGQNSVFRDGDVVRVYYYAAHYLCSGEPAQAQDMSMPREAVSRDL